MTKEEFKKAMVETLNEIRTLDDIKILQILNSGQVDFDTATASDVRSAVKALMISEADCITTYGHTKDYKIGVNRATYNLMYFL